MSTKSSHWITDVIDPEKRSWEDFYRNQIGRAHV